MKARKKNIARKKDPHAGREEARRFASGLSSAILVVGAIVGLVLVAGRWGGKEELARIRIVGRSVLDSVEIMERAGLAEGMKLSAVDLEGVEQRIASHPFIERAAVYHGDHGTLVVEVTERAPAAMTFVGGAPLYLDSQGVVLPYRFSAATFDLPVIWGILGKVSDTAAAEVREGEKGRAGVDSLRSIEALGVVRALRDYDEALYRQISEIVRQENGEYTLVTADGSIPVRAGRPEEIEGRLKKLQTFLLSVLPAHGAASAHYVDLRWRGQVVVRWKEREEV
jgi:cell division protein FtsQ